jgi:fatty acid CoA ligase FadD22
VFLTRTPWFGAVSRRARRSHSPRSGQLNVAAQLADLSDRNGWSDRPAFHTGERSYSHGEVHDLAARAAAVLGDRGVTLGERVLIALPDGIGWVAGFLACARIGAVAVTVNPLVPADDHSFMVQDTQARLVVSGAELTERFSGVRWLDVAELLDRAAGAVPAAAHPMEGTAPLYAQYTSGTTGRPKAAVHAHAHPLAYYSAVGVAALGIAPDDVALSISKLYFAYGFGNALVFPLFSGSSAVLIEGRPTPPVLQEAVARHGVSVLYGVPSAYANLVAEADPSMFRSVRAAVSAGEALRITLAEQTARLLGAPVLEQLGSTEAGHAFCANAVDANRLGTAGRPTDGYRLQLRDVEGNPVGDEVQGELWVSGPSLLLEYLNLPAETREVLVDGWLRTYDLAVRHRDGTYSHAGRVDDMEMVGGITVSPIEIESLLGSHPGVMDVAVAAVANGRGATELRAFVMAVEPGQDHRPLRSQLEQIARIQLAPYKVPRDIQFVDTLPRTPTGKLRRFLLREGRW